MHKLVKEKQCQYFFSYSGYSSLYWTWCNWLKDIGPSFGNRYDKFFTSYIMTMVVCSFVEIIIKSCWQAFLQQVMINKKTLFYNTKSSNLRTCFLIYRVRLDSLLQTHLTSSSSKSLLTIKVFRYIYSFYKDWWFII